MKYFFLFTLSLLGSDLLAQTAIFVAPLINTKVDFCNYGGIVRWGLFNSELQHTQHQNPYYTFHANRVSFQPAINIGIRVGASFKSKKHLVMVEWAQDAARIASKVNSFQTPNTFGGLVQDEGVKNYIQGNAYFSAGFVYDRFSLSYALRMTKEHLPTKVYFLSDISILKNYQNRQTFVYDQHDNYSTSVYFHNDAVLLKREYDYYSYESISMMLGLGLKFDFGFRSKDREFHLFVFEVMYRQGLKDIMASLESKTILDNNEILRFNNSLGSRGSGVYFQISRNFQLYPWIKSKRKELQEQGVYKTKDK